jgi:adenine-specific DNA methylase
MKKQTQSTDLLNFDTGATDHSRLAVWRNIQNSLYSIENPYVGNKRKLVVDIALALDEHGVEYNSVVDLFSGSSVVGLFMKMIGKTVYSNDLLTSSFFNALVFVENNRQVLSSDDLDFLCRNNNPNTGDFVQSNYTNRFLPEEALFLDNYSANIQTMIDSRILRDGRQAGNNPEITTYLASIFRAAAFLTMEHYILNQCFLGGRLNKGQVLAELDHRIGHKRNRGNEMRFLLKELPEFVYEGSEGSKAFNMDAEEFLDKASIPDVDLLYLDPPYGSSQSDYAHMFSFCEEYVHGKKLADLPHIQNAKKFSQKTDYENHFRSLLSKCSRFPTWAVSFNNDSFTDCDGIRKILLDYKKNVEVVNIKYQYKYRKDENSSGVEHLLIAR